MGKYIEIKLKIIRTEDNSILWNTGDGIVILIEEDSAYREFHKYFNRALEEAEKRAVENCNISDVIARLESLKRFDVGAWPDGCPSSDRDDDGDWICLDDVKEIIDELKANAL